LNGAAIAQSVWFRNNPNLQAADRIAEVEKLTAILVEGSGELRHSFHEQRVPPRGFLGLRRCVADWAGLGQIGAAFGGSQRRHRAEDLLQLRHDLAVESERRLRSAGRVLQKAPGNAVPHLQALRSGWFQISAGPATSDRLLRRLGGCGPALVERENLRLERSCAG